MTDGGGCETLLLRLLYCFFLLFVLPAPLREMFKPSKCGDGLAV